MIACQDKLLAVTASGSIRGLTCYPSLTPVSIVNQRCIKSGRDRTTATIESLRVGVDGVCGLSSASVKLSTEIFDFVPNWEVTEGKMDVPKPAFKLRRSQIR